uniref:THAP-type domain-containing protein n=1 Tax=Rhipicephalus appendiculatus TaxID=34631 RepID=A0A131YST0_RHIAP
MTMTCCVPFCSSHAGKSKVDGAPSVSFHEFPVTDIREAWIKAISREGPNKTLWQPHETAKVCSIHFKLEDYKEGMKGRRRLKPNAVPSIFPGYPAYMQRSAESIRRKARTLPQRRLSEAFPTVSTHPPRSKKRLLYDGQDGKEATMETASATSTSKVVDSAHVTAKKPHRNVDTEESDTYPTEPTTHLTIECMPSSKDTQALAGSSHPLVIKVIACEQCPPVTNESSASSGPDVECLDERKTFGTQTTMTGVTMSALCDEIRLLKQRCHDLQNQLNKAQAENCQLRMKIRSNQGPCGT